jgi:hypothetical protein
MSEEFLGLIGGNGVDGGERWRVLSRLLYGALRHHRQAVLRSSAEGRS